MTTRIKASRDVVFEALHGNVRKPHQFLLRLHLDQLDALGRAIDSIDTEWANVSSPFAKPSTT